MEDAVPEGAYAARGKLLAAVSDWHDAAGRPSLRKISGPAGCSHMTVSDLLTGARIPGWPAFSAIAAYLGADLDQARELWLAAVPARSQARRVAGEDPELRAIRIASAMMAQVSQDGQQRVLAYLQDRFGREQS